MKKLPLSVQIPCSADRMTMLAGRKSREGTRAQRELSGDRGL